MTMFYMNSQMHAYVIPHNPNPCDGPGRNVGSDWPTIKFDWNKENQEIVITNQGRNVEHSKDLWVLANAMEIRSPHLI